MRFWKERLNPEKHRDYMSTTHVGGIEPALPHDNLIVRWVYFVNVCSFTFQFHSLEQIEACLLYFSKKTHPSTRLPVELEHYWQRWYERLPMYLFEETKRQKVVKAIEKALVEFAE
jgi:hypothetical protein